MNQHLFSIWISSLKHNHRTIVISLQRNFSNLPFPRLCIISPPRFPWVPPVVARKMVPHKQHCIVAIIKNRHIRQQKQKLSHSVKRNTDGAWCAFPRLRKIEFTRTRYNFIAKLASSWTINTGYTIIVYKVNSIYVCENKQKMFVYCFRVMWILWWRILRKDKRIFMFVFVRRLAVGSYPTLRAL